MGPTNSKEGRLLNFMIKQYIENNPEYIMEQAFKKWYRKTMVSKIKSKYILVETTNFVKNQLYFNVQYFHFVLYNKKFSDNHYDFDICDFTTHEKEINHGLGHDPSRGYEMYKVIKKNRWVIIKCLVIALSLHKRAVERVNHPDRLKQLGTFEQLEI